MPGHLKDLIEVNINSNDDGENEKITCVIADISLGRWPIEVAENMESMGSRFLLWDQESWLGHCTFRS